MTVLCAPDKFRGSLTAAEAAAAMGSGARDAGLEAVELPLADGGEGTLDVILAGRGERHRAVVTGPDGRPVDAVWGLLDDGTAVVELARASGLALVPGANDPIAATTRGTGELIAAAVTAGARRVLLAVGGSATTDGGLGALEALDFELPVPVTIACDVTTAFLDAARVYGPQKGATPEQVGTLTARLESLAARYRAETGVDVSSLPGSGAAGGIAGGLAAHGAVLRPGFDVVADACGMRNALATCAIVVTGEGRLDATSLEGKVVGEVATLASASAVPVAIVAGVVDVSVPGAKVVSLEDVAPGSDTFAEAAALVRRATRSVLEPG